MEKIKLDGRLGFSLELSQEDFNVLTGDDRVAARDLLVGLLQSNQFEIVGDTYFPVEWNEEVLNPIMQEQGLTDLDMEDNLSFDVPLIKFDENNVKEKIENEVKVVRSMDELKEYLEENDWNVHEMEYSRGVPGWMLNAEISANNDFHFEIAHNNNIKEAIKNLKQYAYDFDVEEEVETQLEIREGRNISISVFDLVENVKVIQEMLDEIADGVNWCEQKTIGEIVSEATRRSKEIGVNEVSKNDIDFDKE